MQKVRLAALSLQCSSAPPSVLARRSCARFADAGVPGLLLLLCFASGLELPQMRALSIAVAIALRRHVRSCSPRVLHHTHPVDLACFVQVSMSAIQRGAVVVWHAVLPLENSVVHKIFSRGCAPHPLSLETRFSLYHIKVLHLLANRLPDVTHHPANGLHARPPADKGRSAVQTRSNGNVASFASQSLMP